MLSSVDLPLPEAPMMLTNSPSAMSRLMPLSTCSSLALPRLYDLCMLRNSIIALMMWLFRWRC